MRKGDLYIVATPIGNLEDITLRALKILEETDFILCEDTRESKKILDRFQFSNQLISFNAQTESKKLNSIIKKIVKGESCALISDSGTPTISDPGVRLVNEAIKNDIRIIGIPGPNAAILALSISGLPTDSFLFEGFLPQKKGRQKKLQQLTQFDRTIVLYESTYRIEKLLKELNEYLPDRFIVVQREMTKKFEESWRGYPKELIDSLPYNTIKGEFVVIIAPPKWQSS
ncbi:MAG: 16S rRNA (cytidine(1402)-2'-O)-methyltransferase [Melioribacteraceae bacterium]|nr:16S rRNA (cytidine(1402)-2'-O)-methyltransferase [Melioribacteraceae bacterium]